MAATDGTHVCVKAGHASTVIAVHQGANDVFPLFATCNAHMVVRPDARKRGRVSILSTHVPPYSPECTTTTEFSTIMAAPKITVVEVKGNGHILWVFNDILRDVHELSDLLFNVDSHATLHIMGNIVGRRISLSLGCVSNVGISARTTMTQCSLVLITPQSTQRHTVKYNYVHLSATTLCMELDQKSPHVVRPATACRVEYIRHEEAPIRFPTEIPIPPAHLIPPHLQTYTNPDSPSRYWCVATCLQWVNLHNSTLIRDPERFAMLPPAGALFFKDAGETCTRIRKRKRAAPVYAQSLRYTTRQSKNCHTVLRYQHTDVDIAVSLKSSCTYPTEEEEKLTTIQDRLCSVCTEAFATIGSRNCECKHASLCLECARLMIAHYTSEGRLTFCPLCRKPAKLFA